jgi:hypothetical protein
MYDLLDPKKTPKVPKHIRQRARAVVKHYPIMISFFVDKYNQHYIENLENEKRQNN